MRRSEWADRCKRHPEHRLSKGVCPYCLRDRLSQLSASSSATTTTRASSTATSASPHSSASRHSSPPRRDAAAPPASFAGVSFSQPLAPTTSTALRAAAPEAKGRKEKKKKNIGRFLSRLVGHGQAERRRQAADGGGGELFHSKTMKEKTSSKWVLF